MFEKSISSDVFLNRKFVSGYKEGSVYVTLQSCCFCLVTKSRLTLLRLHGLQPARLLWDFPARKDTGLGCHFLPSWVFPTQGSDLALLLGRRVLYTEPSGKPYRVGWTYPNTWFVLFNPDVLFFFPPPVYFASIQLFYNVCFVFVIENHFLVFICWSYLNTDLTIIPVYLNHWLFDIYVQNLTFSKIYCQAFTK